MLLAEGDCPICRAVGVSSVDTQPALAFLHKPTALYETIKGMPGSVELLTPPFPSFVFQLGRENPIVCKSQDGNGKRSAFKGGCREVWFPQLYLLERVRHATWSRIPSHWQEKELGSLSSHHAAALIQIRSCLGLHLKTPRLHLIQPNVFLQQNEKVICKGQGDFHISTKETYFDNKMLPIKGKPQLPSRYGVPQHGSSFPGCHQTKMGQAPLCGANSGSCRPSLCCTSGAFEGGQCTTHSAHRPSART